MGRKLQIYSDTYDADTLKLLARAFDAAWIEIAKNAVPPEAEDRRTRLALIIFALASSDTARPRYAALIEHYGEAPLYLGSDLVQLRRRGMIGLEHAEFKRDGHFGVSGHRRVGCKPLQPIPRSAGVGVLPGTGPTARQLDQRAEEARAVAAQMRNPDTKHMMARLALTYELLAKHAALREAREATAQKRHQG